MEDKKPKNFRIPMMVFVLTVLSLSCLAVFLIEEAGFLEKEGSKNTGISSQSSQSKVHSVSKPAPELPPDFSGLPKKLASSAMIQELPSNATILLKFFTFTAGKRVWQKEYAITRSNVAEGTIESPDIIIILHSKYVNRFYSQDFCNVIKNAKDNGDVAFQTELSEMALTWKFKSLIEYKSCIV